MRGTVETRGKDKKLDEEIEEAMDEADVEEEINDAVAFSSKIDEALYLAQQKLQETKEADVQAIQETGRHSNHHAKTGRLPKLELPTFDGEPKKWYDFWVIFNAAIHTRSDLAEIEKLQYLKAQLRGAALKLIDGFRLTAANYEMVIEMLQDAYGDTDAIIDAHIIQLAELRSPYNSNVQAMENFRTDMESHLRELDALGIKMDKYGRVLSPLLMKKLPSKWKEHIIRNTGSRHPTLEELRTSLGAELLTMKATETDQAGDRVKTSAPPQMKNATWKKKTLASQTDHMNHTICRLCDSDHFLENCPDFQAMNQMERFNACRSMGSCFRCLGSGHFAIDCRSFKGCKVNGCRGKHHALLHQERSSGGTHEFSSPVTADASTAMQIGHKNHHSSNQNCGAESSAQADTSNRALTTSAGNKSAKSKTVVFQTIPVYAETGRKRLMLNALLDPCSDSSYICQEAAEELGIEGTPWAFELTTVKGVEEVEMRRAPVKISSTESSKKALELNLFVTKDLIGSSKAFDWRQVQKQWPHLEKIPFPVLGKRKNVDLLIGMEANTMCLFMAEEQVAADVGEPVALKTPFGWTAFGPVNAELASGQEKVKTKTGISNFVKTLRTTVAQKSVEEEVTAMNEMTERDLMGIKSEEGIAPSRKEQQILDQVKASIEHDGERYEVAVPWREEGVNLPSNYSAAENRPMKTGRALSRHKDKELAVKCNDIFADYEKKGYLMRLKGDEAELAKEDGWYLPHFPVIRNDKSSTRVRIVYDAAATFKGTSLNSQIYPGPSLYNDLVEVLLRFRQHAVALVGDISEIFLQVCLAEQDRKYHRILWRNMNQESQPAIYEAQRWLFGNAAAPFCTQLVMQENAIKHAVEFPVAADLVLRNFYMDDALTSHPTEAEALGAKTQLEKLMKTAGMKIHKWMSNSSEVLTKIAEPQRAPELQMALKQEGVPPVKTLGVRWLTGDDKFAIKISTDQEEFAFTKRNCLRSMATIFDPLCFFAPCMIKSKILFQETWEMGLNWDDAMPEVMTKQWKDWFDGIEELEKIEVPRCLHSLGQEAELEKQKLHVFSDASEQAYAAAVYVVTESATGERSSTLALARARVAPTKKRLTVPRLELIAAVMGLRLAKKACKALGISLREVHFWCDALDVLCWLRNEVRRFQSCVANRVAEIREHTEPSQWQHCPGSTNPADLPTRGITAAELRHSREWWNGPEFIVEDHSSWPEMKFDPTADFDRSEFRKEPKKCAAALVSSLQFVKSCRLNPELYSNWSRLKRVTAWVFRFLRNMKESTDNRSTQNARAASGETVRELQAEELQRAEGLWVRFAQQEAFSKELVELKEQKRSADGTKRTARDSKISRLCPFLDEEGFLRVGGRLQRADLPFETRHPLLLPKTGAVTKLIVQEYHEDGDHQLGTEHSLAELRQRFWVISGRELIKKIVFKCPECKRRRKGPEDGAR